MKFTRAILLAVSISLLHGLFTNCSMPPGKSAGYDSSGSKVVAAPGGGYNGGGYSGKLTYLFFAMQNTCSAQYEADSKIEYDAGVYYETAGTCGGSSQTHTVLAAQNAWDPFYLLASEKVYFLDQGDTALPAGTRVVNWALCTNAANKVDVAIRIEQVSNPVTHQWDTQVKGQWIAASSSAQGYDFKEEPGRLTDPDVNGTSTFGFNGAEGVQYNNSFHLKIFNYGSGFKVTGEIQPAGGAAMPADCYILKNM